VIWIQNIQDCDLWEPNIFMDHNVQNITTPIRKEVGRILLLITINK
jgi:hypothetical protein